MSEPIDDAIARIQAEVRRHSDYPRRAARRLEVHQRWLVASVVHEIGVEALDDGALVTKWIAFKRLARTAGMTA